MEYELRIRQQYNINLNDEDLEKTFVTQDEDALDVLVSIVRDKVDGGDRKGTLYHADLVEWGYDVFVSSLQPDYIRYPETIKIRWTAEYEEDSW